MDKAITRSQLRERTFVMLFCKEFHNLDEMSEQIAYYLANFEDLSAIDREQIRSRTEDVLGKIEELDEKYLIVKMDMLLKIYY